MAAASGAAAPSLDAVSAGSAGSSVGGEVLDVDLCVRTGGEARLSNFLLWHLAYAELMPLPILWPDFTQSDLEGCFREYGRRERRFGREKAGFTRSS